MSETGGFHWNGQPFEIYSSLRPQDLFEEWELWHDGVPRVDSKRSQEFLANAAADAARFLTAPKAMSQKQSEPEEHLPEPEGLGDDVSSLGSDVNMGVDVSAQGEVVEL